MEEELKVEDEEEEVDWGNEEEEVFNDSCTSAKISDTHQVCIIPRYNLLWSQPVGFTDLQVLHRIPTSTVADFRSEDFVSLVGDIGISSGQKYKMRKKYIEEA